MMTLKYPQILRMLPLLIAVWLFALPVHARYSGGSNRVLYVDDIEVARDTQASLAGSTGNLTLEAGSTLAPGSFWKGLIDDVRIYNRVEIGR